MWLWLHEANHGRCQISYRWCPLLLKIKIKQFLVIISRADKELVETRKSYFCQTSIFIHYRKAHKMWNPGKAVILIDVKRGKWMHTEHVTHLQWDPFLSTHKSSWDAWYVLYWRDRCVFMVADPAVFEIPCLRYSLQTLSFGHRRSHKGHLVHVWLCWGWHLGLSRTEYS